MKVPMASRLVFRAAYSVGAGIVLASHTAAFATVSASAYVSDERVQGATTPAPATGLVTATQTGGSVGGSQFATAFADASAGVLKASTQAGLDGPVLLPATAATELREDISFSGGFGGIAYLDWSFHGNIALSNSPYGPGYGAAYGQFSVYEATVFGSSSQYTTLSPYPYACGAGCVVGTSIDTSGTLAIPIDQYGATIIASLSTFATYGNLADFGNTSKLYLRLPDGVTFTSSSGRFLEAAQPVFTSAVPEPANSVLLMAGLAAVGIVSRRRAAHRR